MKSEKIGVTVSQGKRGKMVQEQVRDGGEKESGNLILKFLL